MTEDRLAQALAATARGDRAAFRALYGAAAPKLFGICLRILRDRAEAEDALQEIFTRVWSRAGRYEAGKAAAMTWMIVIARNHCIDRLRARPAASEGEEALAEVADGGPGVEARLMAGDAARRVADCFDELPDDRAAAIRGAYLDGLSYEALAARHGVPLNTMRSWLRRGLLRLKECLER